MRIIRRARARATAGRAMHGRAVVPHHDVAAAPLMLVAGARRRRDFRQFVDQFFSRRGVHAFDRVGMRGEIDRAAAVDRILPHHAPAYRRQRRALLGAGKVGRDLAARMRIIVPGERIFQFRTRTGVEPLEGKPGRDALGLATARRMTRAGRVPRPAPASFLKDEFGMPELAGLAAHGLPVIGRHYFSVGADGGEDDEMRAGALRADLGHSPADPKRRRRSRACSPVRHVLPRNTTPNVPRTRARAAWRPASALAAILPPAPRRAVQRRNPGPSGMTSIGKCSPAPRRPTLRVRWVKASTDRIHHKGRSSRAGPSSAVGPARAGTHAQRFARLNASVQRAFAQPPQASWS